jgi:hypothetical protein
VQQVTTRTTPRQIDPTFVRDESLRDVKERSDDVGDLLPPTGAHVTSECVREVYAAYRRLGAAINRLNEAHERVVLCASRDFGETQSIGPDVAIRGFR